MFRVSASTTSLLACSVQFPLLTRECRYGKRLSNYRRNHGLLLAPIFEHARWADASAAANHDNFQIARLGSRRFSGLFHELVPWSFRSHSHFLDWSHFLLSQSSLLSQ